MDPRAPESALLARLIGSPLSAHRHQIAPKRAPAELQETPRAAQDGPKRPHAPTEPKTEPRAPRSGP
eukprot:5673797-Pyramimonas_sp.AAC.1